MKKTLYTLNVDNYDPDVTAITYPLLKQYASKIGAEFYPITERKWPDWPVMQEKMQIYTLIQERGDDWAIYIDSDALVHPDSPDFTELMSKDTVAIWMRELAITKCRSDDYFRRDGRFIGTGGWLAIVSDWCRDFWKPIDDLTKEEILARITPRIGETWRVEGHQIDSYTTSRNVARYGLKITTMPELLNGHRLEPENLFFHDCFIPSEKRAAVLRAVIARMLPSEQKMVRVSA